MAKRREKRLLDQYAAEVVQAQDLALDEFELSPRDRAFVQEQCMEVAGRALELVTDSGRKCDNEGLCVVSLLAAGLAAARRMNELRPRV